MKRIRIITPSGEQETHLPIRWVLAFGFQPRNADPEWWTFELKSKRDLAKWKVAVWAWERKNQSSQNQ